MTAPLCFIDTETDGVHPGRKAWEVAWIRREPDGTETEAHLFLPIDLATSDPNGLRVGRFYDRHPHGRRVSRPVGERTGQVTAEKSAAAAIARATHGAHIVGAVPNFDTEVLDRLLRANGHAPAWQYRLVDVLSLTAGYVGGLVGGLTDCATACGIRVDSALEHTALGDARTALRIYDHVMGAQRAEEAA